MDKNRLEITYYFFLNAEFLLPILNDDKLDGVKAGGLSGETRALTGLTVGVMTGIAKPAGELIARCSSTKSKADLIGGVVGLAKARNEGFKFCSYL